MLREISETIKEETEEKVLIDAYTFGDDDDENDCAHEFTSKNSINIYNAVKTGLEKNDRFKLHREVKWESGPKNDPEVRAWFKMTNGNYQVFYDTNTNTCTVGRIDAHVNQWFEDDFERLQN